MNSTIVSSLVSAREKRPETKTTSDVFSSLRTVTESMFEQRTRNLSKTNELNEEITKVSEEVSNAQVLLMKLTEEIAQIDAICERGNVFIKERTEKLNELTKTLDRVSSDHRFCSASIDRTKRSVHVVEEFIHSFRFNNAASTTVDSSAPGAPLSLAALMAKGNQIQNGREPHEFRELGNEIHRQMRIFCDYLNEMQRTGIFNPQLLSLLQEWGRLMGGSVPKAVGVGESPPSSPHPELFAVLRRFEAIQDLPSVLHHAYQYMTSAGLGGLPCKPSGRTVIQNESSTASTAEHVNTEVLATEGTGQNAQQAHHLILDSTSASSFPAAAAGSTTPPDSSLSITAVTKQNIINTHQNNFQTSPTVLSITAGEEEEEEEGKANRQLIVAPRRSQENESPLDTFCAYIAPLFMWWYRNDSNASVQHRAANMSLIPTASAEVSARVCYLPDAEYWCRLSFSPDRQLSSVDATHDGDSMHCSLVVPTSNPQPEEAEEAVGSINSRVFSGSHSSPPFFTPEQILSTLRQRRTILLNMRDIVKTRSEALGISCDLTYFSVPLHQREEESHQIQSLLNDRVECSGNIESQKEALCTSQRALEEVEAQRESCAKKLLVTEEEIHQLEAKSTSVEASLEVSLHNWYDALAMAAQCSVLGDEQQNQVDLLEAYMTQKRHAVKEIEAHTIALCFSRAVETLVAEADLQYLSIIVEEQEDLEAIELQAENIILAQQREIHRVGQAFASSLQSFTQRHMCHQKPATGEGKPFVHTMPDGHNSVGKAHLPENIMTDNTVTELSETLCQEYINALSHISLSCGLMDAKEVGEARMQQDSLRQGTDLEEAVAVPSLSADIPTSGNYSPHNPSLRPSTISSETMIDEFSLALSQQRTATVLWMKQKDSTAEMNPCDNEDPKGTDDVDGLSHVICTQLLEYFSHAGHIHPSADFNSATKGSTTTTGLASSPLAEWLVKYNCQEWIYLPEFPFILSRILSLITEWEKSDKDLASYEEEKRSKINAMYAVVMP